MSQNPLFSPTFAEVDIEVPRDLWEEFEEFPPIFINQSIGEEGIPQHMKDYLAKSGRVATPNQKKLLGVLKAKKVLLYAPLLKWYFEHGPEITAVHRTIDYIPQKIFDWFVQEVASMRRKEDAEADKALLAEIYKLLGNSAYGKFIEAVERQTKVLYTKDEDEVDKYLRSAYFEDLEEIGDAYKMEFRKNKVTINRPFQVGIVVYQLAKLNVTVLLRLLGQVHRTARLRADPDGYRQYVLRPFVRHSGRSSKARTSEGV